MVWFRDGRKKDKHHMMTNWQKSFDNVNSIKAATEALPEKVFKDLRKVCDKARKKKLNVKKDLVGHINEEYDIKPIPKNFNDFILKRLLRHPVIAERNKKLAVVTHDRPFCIDKLWCNYQKKYEFNPPHDHAGIYSFVVFMQIPYDLHKEETYFTKIFADNFKPMASKFAFQNVTPDGEISTDALPVDKSFEGKIIVFPSKQVHTVFPFYTSNDYRITVSGNIKLAVPKEW